MKKIKRKDRAIPFAVVGENVCYYDVDYIVYFAYNIYTKEPLRIMRHGEDVTGNITLGALKIAHNRGQLTYAPISGGGDNGKY